MSEERNIHETGKYCAGCAKVRLFAEFASDRTKKDGLQTRCRECKARSVHDWRMRNIERNLQYESERRRTGRREYTRSKRARRDVDINRLRAFGYFGNRCARCGETDLDALQIETSGSQGIYQLLRGSWARLEAELRQCQLLCANCHARKAREDRGLPSLNEYRDLL